MATNGTSSAIKTRNILRALYTAGGILLIPFLATLYTDEVNWNLADFVIMGALLVGIGLLQQHLSFKARTKKQRLIINIGLLIIIIYVWAELAVGVFTSIGS